MEPGVPNKDQESCSVIALSSALRETLPHLDTICAASFVAEARTAFPDTKNPFLLMEELALKDFVVTARRFTACGCPATENQHIEVTYVRPESTPTTRPIHLQAACSSLGQSVPCKCDRCKALTVAVHSIDGTPEYIALETPRHRVTTEGEIITDEDFPGLYQESQRPIYVNGLPYRLTAVICTTPNHFLTVVPRGRIFLKVDDGNPVTRLKPKDVVTLFRGSLVTFLARLHSVRAPECSLMYHRIIRHPRQTPLHSQARARRVSQPPKDADRSGHRHWTSQANRHRIIESSKGATPRCTHQPPPPANARHQRVTSCPNPLAVARGSRVRHLRPQHFVRPPSPSPAERRLSPAHMDREHLRQVRWRRI